MSSNMDEFFAEEELKYTERIAQEKLREKKYREDNPTQEEEIMQQLDPAHFNWRLLVAVEKIEKQLQKLGRSGTSSGI